MLGVLMLLGCDDASPPTAGFDVPEPQAAAGGGAASGGGSANVSQGGMPPTLPPISSDWMMQGFEDPVAISFARHIGCFTGLPAVDGPDEDCGTLRTLGNEGRRLTFAMTFQSVPLLIYAADAYVSEDGSRMAGTFISFQPPTGDVPLPAVDTWLLGYAWFPLTRSLSFSRTREELPAPEPAATFRLDETEPSDGELKSGQDYRFVLRDTGRGMSIIGDLGAYFDTELRWDAALQALFAGPVAATAPGYPIALEINYVDGQVNDARATTASGSQYHLLRVKD
jgi:hypothetical protein